jgi:hypothetical protein
VQRAAALRRFIAGNALFARARYTAALVEYQRAVQLWDHPSIRYNMAVCYIHRNQNLQAWQSLQSALRFGQGPLSRDRYRRAITYQKLLRGRLAFVRITCEEPGAEVSLDGELLFTGRGQAHRTLEPEPHVAVASKAGFITTKHRLRLRAGTLTEVRLGLVPLRAAFSVRRRWKHFIPWTVLGSAVAVGLLGMSLTLQARTDMSRYNRQFAEACPDGCVKDSPAPGETVLPIPSHLVTMEARARAMNAAGIGLLAAAGVAAVVGVTLLILNRPIRRERKPRIDVRQRRLTVAPLLGPGGGGLIVRLRY